MFDVTGIEDLYYIVTFKNYKENRWLRDHRPDLKARMVEFKYSAEGRKLAQALCDEINEALKAMETE